MGSTYSRSLLAVLVVVLVAAPVAGAVGMLTTVTTAETDSRDAVAVQPQVSQTANGSLRVRLNRSTVGNDSAVLLTLNGSGGERTRNVTASETTNTTHIYTVPPEDLPTFSLAETTVTVTSQDRNTTYVRKTLDLRYLALSESSARFEERHLELDANPVAGIPNEATVSLTAEAADGRSATLRATVNDGVVRLERSEAFTDFLTLPTELTLRAAPSGPTLAGSVSIDLAATAKPSTRVLQVGSGLAVESPLLVDGQRYDVRLDTTRPSGTYVFTGNASGGTITTSNQYLAGADEITVTVEMPDGQPVLNHSEPTGSAYNATVTGESTVSTDSDLPGESVTLALLVTSDDIYVVENVSINRNNVTLSDLPAELARNGSYQLGLAFDGDRSAVINVGTGEPASLLTENNTAGPIGNEWGDGLVPGVFTGERGTPLQIAAFALVLVLVTTVGYGGFWFVSSNSRTASSTPRSREIRVSVVDGQTGASLDDRVKLGARRTDGKGGATAKREEQVTGGSTTLTVPMGVWEVAAVYNGVRDSRTVRMSTDNVRLALGPVSTQIRVIDESSDPVEGANVRASYGGGSDSDRTGPGGTATLQLPATATNIEVTASHDRFESDQFAVEKPTGVPDTMRLVGKTGTIEVNTTIDGQPSDAVDVSLETDDDWLQERLTDSADDGITIEGLPIGEYEFIGRVDREQFSTARSAVTVREDQTARVSLDVAFTFDLSPDQRGQLDELRSEASELAPSGRLDSAIHRYYASVAESLADTIESVPAAGERFAKSGVDPSLAVEGMLSAGRGALASVDNAMNSKHNVDLFSACADMREASVNWEGGYDLGSFLELAEADRVTQRAELKSTFSETESVLEANRGEVSVVSPVQNALAELQAYEHETRESNQVRNAAFVFVLSGFADAVQGLFDHPRLVDRLDRTVY